MSSLRLERVRELLKREIGEVIRREFPAGAGSGLITVNDVTMSADLHSASVYIGILGNAEQKKHGWHLLQHHRKRIQGLVGRSVILKYTPQLRFVMDESLEQGNKVLKIMEDLERTGSVGGDTTNH
jgi:ribosome-binding factor A